MRTPIDMKNALEQYPVKTTNALLKKKYIEKASYYQVSTAAEWFVASQRQQADLKVKRLALKLPLIMVEFSSFIS